MLWIERIQFAGEGLSGMQDAGVASPPLPTADDDGVAWTKHGVDVHQGTDVRPRTYSQEMSACLDGIVELVTELLKPSPMLTVHQYKAAMEQLAVVMAERKFLCSVCSTVHVFYQSSGCCIFFFVVVRRGEGMSLRPLGYEGSKALLDQFDGMLSTLEGGRAAGMARVFEMVQEEAIYNASLEQLQNEVNRLCDDVGSGDVGVDRSRIAGEAMTVWHSGMRAVTMAHGTEYPAWMDAVQALVPTVVESLRLRMSDGEVETCVATTGVLV